jgi:hypothetical protein
MSAAEFDTKDPAESLPYTFDFAGQLVQGETVSGVTSVSATPSGLTLSGAPVLNGSIVTQRITGGTSGARYLVSAQVTTSQGNTRVLSAWLPVGVGAI